MNLHLRYGVIAFFAIILWLLSAPKIYAYTLIERSNEMISSMQDGVIRDRSNTQIGKIESDGIIRDRSNSQIGKIESDGTIRNRNNAQIGKVQSDGIVRDRSYSQIGKIESDGTVRDRSNSQIGSASGIKKEWVAVAFFFFVEML